MKHELEHEKRVMLSKTQYIKLCKDEIKRNQNVSNLQITNYYFENETVLLDKHIVLRIRVTNNKKFEVQLKIKGNNGDEEYHNEINKEALNIYLHEGLVLDDDMFSKLKPYGIKENYFYSKASLNTKRLEIKYNDYLLVIDKNTYFDIIDYNLEIESYSLEYAEEIIKNYCNKYNLKYDENYLSKTRRVFRRIK